MSKMNLPNKLSILRLCLVPICIFAVLLPAAWVNPYVSGVIAAVVFIFTAFTDMLDGKIARKYGLITDFGKFIDPLADKFMVIGTMLALFYRFDDIRAWFFWGLLIVIFREFAVTSIRLVASKNAGLVVAASWLGKIKTVTQIICICTILLEPVLFKLLSLAFSDVAIFASLEGWRILGIITTVLMTFFTLWSGIDYLKSYWKYLDTEK
ncbi:MAG: CDP-diacylglycerol--glycerol-3-phosphate 3-phosphatidyltransferase [Clostridia bacterium]|nr:CDP-diacylglycerol--glycerol-3-phosphate 3-phosphatidyltransferase [Clostridia bacterium]